MSADKKSADKNRPTFAVTRSIFAANFWSAVQCSCQQNGRFVWRRSVHIPVNSSHGQLFTHYMRLVTQSTRHKQTYKKATSRKFFLSACEVGATHYPETVLNADSVITASEHIRRHNVMLCSSVWLFEFHEFHVCNIEVTDDGKSFECNEI